MTQTATAWRALLEALKRVFRCVFRTDFAFALKTPTYQTCAYVEAP